jgi:hypothetical protein
VRSIHTERPAVGVGERTLLVALLSGLEVTWCPPCLGTGFDRGQERRGICKNLQGERSRLVVMRWLNDEKLEPLAQG